MKYECPHCNNQLDFWQEYAFDKLQTVNKMTGKLNKSVRKSDEHELDTRGLSCDSCGFMYYENGGNETGYSHLDEVLRKV